MLESLRSVVKFRKFERNRAARRLARVANVEDLRLIAKRRLPSGVFDYIDGAAEDELSANRNSERFRDIELCPRVLRDVSDIATGTKVLGYPVPFPLILSPTGFTRLADPLGELAVCRSSARNGIPYVLSTMATRSIEEVAKAQNEVAEDSNGGRVNANRRWFQVYVWRDRGLMRELLERARVAGYEAITITVDTAVLGRRERDIRRGFTIPPKLGLDTILDGVLHPSWTWKFVRADPIKFANVVGKSTDDGSSPVSLADHMERQFDPSLSWHDIEWFRSEWDGPIIIKGIQSVADALIAADLGVEAIALSNHGGRQLDGSPAPIDLLAPVAEAVSGRIELYCDGGIRRGSDIVKAVSLGATACMVGRAHLYALAAAGEKGVDWLIDFLASGMKQTMALTGARCIADLTPELVRWSSEER